jgi:hypothetical protein
MEKSIRDILLFEFWGTDASTKEALRRQRISKALKGKKRKKKQTFSLMPMESMIQSSKKAVRAVFGYTPKKSVATAILGGTTVWGLHRHHQRKKLEKPNMSKVSKSKIAKLAGTGIQEPALPAHQGVESEE